jgi:ribonuclease P/MRP protein subunit POP5
VRRKRRYIAFELTCEASKRDISWTINQVLHVRKLEVGKTMLKLVLYDTDSRRGLLRCGHKQVNEVKTAMLSIKNIGGKEASFLILGVSGTIKAAERKFLVPA